MSPTSFTSLALPLLLTLGCATGAGAPRPASTDAEYDPKIDPANFQAVIDNPYYSLAPGTTFRYLETDGDETADVEVTVTRETKVVMGVTCTVVRDVVRENGVVKEDTFDWFAQDKQGNVWYFGEETTAFRANGEASTAGSWEAGVGSSRPGIIMPGQPAPGDPYRQEYRPGHAEDMGQVVAVGETVTMPYGTLKNCVRTKDWSLLEPGHESKWYAHGVGLVREESSGGGVLTLVSMTPPDPRNPQ